MAHQSLYRRYRPRRFDEVRGQEHVVGALRNAVREQTEGHAYLFSGPRGTGKTSTARILAKALNCENLQGGEPCCECTPCVDMEAGRSFDLFELDAASNRGIDDIKQLIERTSVGSPGRMKMYILDEVHMLTKEASNALLKTLEEPPEHVRFVLATTDPQKVLPTIKSRTQHFEFQLLSADELERQVRAIATDAELDVDEEAIAWVVQKGRGSSRDTLSALDQVVAAGGVVARDQPVELLYEALVARDTGAAVLAVAEALSQGHDPRVLGAAFLDSLRDAFLLSLGVEVPHLMAADQERYGAWATALGTPVLTRAMEAIGSALVDMRQAADPRVPLEVALVRLTSATDASVDGLVARIERLEQALTSGPSPTASAPTPEAPDGAAAPPPSASARAEAADAPAAPSTEATPGSGGGPAQARAALAKLRAGDANGSDAGDASADAPARTAPMPAAPPQRSGPPRAPTPPSAPSPPKAPQQPRTAPSASSEAPAPEAPAPEAPAPEVDTPEVDTPEVDTPEVDTPEVDTPEPGELASADVAEPSERTEHEGATPAGSFPTTDEVAAAFESVVVPSMKGVAKAIFTAGQVLEVSSDTVVFALALGAPMDRAERSRADVEGALASHFGRPVPIRLVDDAEAASRGVAGSERAAPQISGGSVDLTEPEVDEDMTIDIRQLADADDVAETGIDRLTKAFPGAELVNEDEVST